MEFREAQSLYARVHRLCTPRGTAQGERCDCWSWPIAAEPLGAGGGPLADGSPQRVPSRTKCSPTTTETAE